MTVIDKRDRIERLATEPLFYYRTLRDHVEQLDSLKVAFQYLLAAYELNMDPAVKAEYEEAKRAKIEAQLSKDRLRKPFRVRTPQPIRPRFRAERQVVCLTTSVRIWHRKSPVLFPRVRGRAMR
jgi:hypothetical protein